MTQDPNGVGGLGTLRWAEAGVPAQLETEPPVGWTKLCDRGWAQRGLWDPRSRKRKRSWRLQISALLPTRRQGLLCALHLGQGWHRIPVAEAAGTVSGQAVSLVEWLYEERVDSLLTSPGPPSRSSSVGSEGLPAGPPSST